MIKSAEDVMRIAAERGFTFGINPGPPPMPFIRTTNGGANRLDATDALQNALKAWRLEIIAIIEAEEKAKQEATEI